MKELFLQLIIQGERVQDLTTITKVLFAWDIARIVTIIVGIILVIIVIGIVYKKFVK